MSTEEFIQHIRRYCIETAIRATLENAAAPPHRQPTDHQIRTAEWFASLDQESFEMVRGLVSEASEEAAFGMMCLLDGVRVVSDEQITDPPGEFVLEFRTQQGVTRLNDPDNEFLHDLL